MGAVRGGSSRQAIAARPAHVVLSPRLGSRDADLLPGDRARRPAGCYRALPGLEPGHSVILPQLLGWTGVVAAQSASESYFLAFLVGLHVATALALMLPTQTFLVISPILNWGVIGALLWFSTWYTRRSERRVVAEAIEVQTA